MATFVLPRPGPVPTFIPASPLITPAAGPRLDFVFEPGIRAGVIITAAIGCITVVLLVLMLVHIVTVTFLPLLPSFLFFREKYLHRPPSLSRVPSMHASMHASSHPNWSHASNMEKAVVGVDANAGHTLAERQARARAIETSRQKQMFKRERASLRLQLGIFILCMFTSDMIQSLGGVIQAKWAAMGGIQDGPLCWTQAVMITFGDVSTSIWNAIIAFHTFYTIVLMKRMSITFVLILMAFGWALPIFLILLGAYGLASPARGNFWGLAGAWCFIGKDYALERVLLHYLPMFVSAIGITIMYSMVFLTIRGHLVLANGFKGTCFTPFRFSFSRRNALQVKVGSNQDYLRALSLKMLWYPAAYMALVFPIAMVRFIELAGADVSLDVLLSFMCLLFLVGISNVLIYVTTRNLGGPANPAKPNTNQNTKEGPTQVEVFVEATTVTYGTKKEDPDLKIFDHFMQTRSAKYSDESDEPMLPEQPYIPTAPSSQRAVMTPKKTHPYGDPNAAVAYDRTNSDQYERDSMPPFRHSSLNRGSQPRVSRTGSNTSSGTFGDNRRANSQARDSGRSRQGQGY